MAKKNALPDWLKQSAENCAEPLPAGSPRRPATSEEVEQYRCASGDWMYPLDELVFMVFAVGRCDVIRFDNLIDYLKSFPDYDRDAISVMEHWRKRAKECIERNQEEDADGWLYAMHISMHFSAQRLLAIMGAKSRNGPSLRKDQAEKRAFQAWLKTSSRVFSYLDELNNVPLDEMGRDAYAFACEKEGGATRKACRDAYNEVRPGTLKTGRRPKDIAKG